MRGRLGFREWERRERSEDHMGGERRIANPEPRMERSSRFGPSKQRIGCGAMSAGLVAVGTHTNNLGFEQRDTGVQLVLRIGA